MRTVSTEAFRKADDFVLRTARVLERHRFAALFRGGPVAPVLSALDAYRNADGGYGNALEPDGRGPGSQPVTVLTALHLLIEAGATDTIPSVCDYLDSVTAPDGGVPFVHPNARDYPRAPWWQIPERVEGSLIPTANIVGALRAAAVRHPWVERAAAFCVPRIESLTATHPYEAIACVAFLDSAPDREWAETWAERIGGLVRDAGFVRLPGVDTVTPPGYNPAELQDPHDYATAPDSLARRWFTDEEFEDSLDRLVAAQHDDGGWRVRWASWTPVTEFEWAGVQTVEVLALLRRFGRLPEEVTQPHA